MVTINRFAGIYWFLSNFYQCNMMIDGLLYATVEHYFQSQKSLDENTRILIQHADSPRGAKRLGRQCLLRPDWERIKGQVMFKALSAKFSSSYLRHRLLETGDRELIEGNVWGDWEWGQVNGVGKNKLGKMLMRLRTELRERMVIL